MSFFVRRRFPGDFDFDQDTVVIAKPYPIGIDTGRRIKTLNSHGLQPFGEALDIVFKGAKRYVAVFFSRTFADSSPQMRMFKGFKGDGVAALADVETEFAVEIFRDAQGPGQRSENDRLNGCRARRAAGWAQ